MKLMFLPTLPLPLLLLLSFCTENQTQGLAPGRHSIYPEIKTTTFKIIWNKGQYDKSIHQTNGFEMLRLKHGTLYISLYDDPGKGETALPHPATEAILKAFPSTYLDPLTAASKDDHCKFPQEMSSFHGIAWLLLFLGWAHGPCPSPAIHSHCHQMLSPSASPHGLKATSPCLSCRMLLPFLSLLTLLVYLTARPQSRSI